MFDLLTRATDARGAGFRHCCRPTPVIRLADGPGPMLIDATSASYERRKSGKIAESWLRPGKMQLAIPDGPAHRDPPFGTKAGSIAAHRKGRLMNPGQTLFPCGFCTICGGTWERVEAS